VCGLQSKNLDGHIKNCHSLKPVRSSLNLTFTDYELLPNKNGGVETSSFLSTVRINDCVNVIEELKRNTSSIFKINFVLSSDFVKQNSGNQTIHINSG